MKKFVSAFVLLFFIFSTLAHASLLSAPTNYVEEKGFFSDVDTYHENYDAIDWMQRNAVVSGYEDGTFKPDVCVNRVEFLKMLFKSLSVDETAYSAELFSDTPSDSWYAAYVKTARAKGVINGYADGTFKPEQCVSRAEANKMALVMNYSMDEIDSVENIPNWYSDLTEEDWYYNYAGFSYSRNFWSDYDYEKIGANDGMNRAEVAELLYRIKSVKDNGKISYAWDQPLDFGEKMFYEGFNYDYWPSSSSNSSLSVYPEDLDIFLSLNYGEDGNRENFEAMLKKFPDAGLWNSFSDSMFYNVEDDNNFFKLIDPLLADDFEVSLGVKFVLDDLDFSNIENSEVYVAGKVSDGDKFYEILKKTLALNYMHDMTCEVDGNFLFWTSEYDDFYLARYGDVFFLTNTASNRIDAVNRLKNKSSMEFASKVSENLAYMYMDGNVLYELLKLDLGEESMAGILAYYEQMGDVDFSLRAESSSVLKMDSSVVFNDSTYLDKYRSNELELVNKLPGKNLFAYMEDKNFKLMLDPYLDTFSSEILNVASYASDDVYSEIGLTKDELLNLFDSSYAVSLSDVDELLPGVVMALKVDNSQVANAEKLIEWVSTKVDEFVEEAVSETVSIDLNNYLVRTDSAFGGLHRVKLDMKSLPENFWIDEGVLEEKAMLGESVFDFWYGLKKDGDMNVMIVALYPNLDSEYAVDVVSANNAYKNAVSELNGNYGSSVFYMNVNEFMNYVDKIMMVFGEDLNSNDEYLSFKKWVMTIDYFISSGKVVSNKIVGSGIMKLK